MFIIQGKQLLQVMTVSCTQITLKGRKAYVTSELCMYLQILVACFKVIIYQKMIKKTWRVGLIKLSTSIFQSFLNLLLCFCTPV
jgi:hypothetical protein